MFLPVMKTFATSMNEVLPITHLQETCITAMLMLNNTGVLGGSLGRLGYREQHNIMMN